MNLVELLTPINGDSPSGEDLSFSVEFDQIAELRREDDPTLDQGEWVTALKVADWPGVVAACEALLKSRTKDLRLTMWLTEALALTRGFEGLAQGLTLCHDLCERYWDNLHPQADDGDMEQRVGNMAWLLHRLVTLAPTRAITRGRNGSSYSLQDLAVAQSLQALQERSPDEAARQAEDKVTLDQFMRSLRETPRDWLAAQHEHVQAAQAQLLRWQSVIDARLGADGPSFVPAKEALANTLVEVTRLAREMGALDFAALHEPAMPSTDHSDGLMLDSPATTGSVSALRGGPVNSRAQALQQLREVAQFFRRTEPHSPVAYLADKAVAWAEMPLHEWLRRVVKDQGSMAHLHELLGIEPEQGSGHQAF
jgi:type VI secretion system protein ImpA